MLRLPSFLLLAACGPSFPDIELGTAIADLTSDEAEALCSFYDKALDGGVVDCDGLQLDFDPGRAICLEDVAAAEGCTLTVAEFDACYSAMEEDPCWLEERPAGCEAFDVCFPLE